MSLSLDPLMFLLDILPDGHSHNQEVFATSPPNDCKNNDKDLLVEIRTTCRCTIDLTSIVSGTADS